MCRMADNANPAGASRSWNFGNEGILRDTLSCCLVRHQFILEIVRLAVPLLDVNRVAVQETSSIFYNLLHAAPQPSLLRDDLICRARCSHSSSLPILYRLLSLFLSFQVYNISRLALELRVGQL